MQALENRLTRQAAALGDPDVEGLEFLAQNPSASRREEAHPLSPAELELTRFSDSLAGIRPRSAEPRPAERLHPTGPVLLPQ